MRKETRFYQSFLLLDSSVILYTAKATKKSLKTIKKEEYK